MSLRISLLAVALVALAAPAAADCRAEIAAVKQKAGIAQSKEQGPEKQQSAQSGQSGQSAQQNPSARSGTKRSEEHTSELQSLMRTSYAVFCLNKQQQDLTTITTK